MRSISDRPKASRFRTPLLLVAGLALVLFLSANGVAAFYTDWLWFDSLGQQSVWSTMRLTQIFLVAVFSSILFAVLWGNLILADRLKPVLRTRSAEDDLVERYNDLVGDHAGKLRLGIAAVFGLVSGANTSSQWKNWLLFRSGGSFDWSDPLFGRDAGFYVFRLPFWSFVVDWLFATSVLTVIVMVFAHYLNGGIRASSPDEKVSSGVKMHLSILLAVLAVLRAVGYWLDRFHLLTSQRGAYDGALTTDVNIQLPALNLLTLISLFCAALFVANIRRTGWGLPMVALGIWLVANIVVGGIFPAAYQRLRVQNVQSQREAEFVAHNISATKFAYGLDEDALTEFRIDYEEGVSRDDLSVYEDLIFNIPVVDPDLASDEVNRDEAERGTFEFANELDVDRYEIDGQSRPVVVSPRRLDFSSLANKWEDQHIIFTHGYGAVMAASYDTGEADPDTASRRLNYLVEGLENPAVAPGVAPGLAEPRTYFGEAFNDYAVVGATRQEVDFQRNDNTQQLTSYDGEAGVPIGSVMRRLAFSLRFSELDLLISRSVSDDSKILYHRNVRDRVQELAPFLTFDNNPYPILREDGITWILSGYTTSSEFPYAQSSPNPLGNFGPLDFNYVRDSVKATVDAYTGEVTLYVIDEDDPVIAAWRQSFPTLFADFDDMPADIEAHLKYPEDIFNVQSQVWSTYQEEDPTQFIEGTLAWSVATQPPLRANLGVDGEGSISDPMPSQYLMARLPDSDETEFVLQRVFVPGDSKGGEDARPTITGILMARSDPGKYGELVLLERNSGEVSAPSRIDNDIRKNGEVTEFIGRKEIAKDNVLFGEMSTVVVENTVLFVRPIYVESSSGNSIPELQRIVAATGVTLGSVEQGNQQTTTRISMGRTLEEAIDGVLGAAPLDLDSSGYDPTGKSVNEMLGDADALVAAAAINPDEEEAGQQLQRAQAALQAAKEALTGSTEPQAPVDAAPAATEDGTEDGAEVDADEDQPAEPPEDDA